MERWESPHVSKATIMLKNKRKTLVALLAIGMLCLTMQCNPDEENQGGSSPDHVDPLAPKPAITTTVMGVVIDEHGKPVADAEVSVHGETAVTGPDGSFIFYDIEVPGNRCVVHSKKEGYFSGIRALTPEENGQTETRIVLMGSPVTHTFEASTGSNAALAGGSAVQIPANGLVDDTGNTYSGRVKMSVRYLDPTAGNFGVLVPGGDMLARREDQSTSVLYSYGILRVQMTDLGGANLQLAPGSTSTLIMNIPEEQQATAPETIPLWYFDEEAGVWQEDGSAKRDGNRYVGTVTHFTDWNCDEPTEGATIVGRLVDCDNEPAYGIVEFGQVTSDPQSSTVTGESDGRFERRVPDGIQLTVIITDPLMITPLTQNERGKVIVIVPPLAPGQVYDVGDIQTFPCAATVKATFNTAQGDQVQSVSFESPNGYQSVQDPGTNLDINLPAGIKVTMVVGTANGIVVGHSFETPGERETLDLGVIDLTASRNAGEAQITGRTVCYGEIETNGQISVTWDDGDGNSGTNYSAPEADGSWSIVAPVNTTVVISSSTQHGTWEKILETPSNPGQVLDLGIMELCQNEMVGETSFRVTGGGMNNQLITVVSNENNIMTNMGAYTPGSNVTIAAVEDLNSDIYMGIVFPGNETGPRKNQEELAVMIERQINNTTIYYWGGYMAENSALQMDITKYGDVGEVIEGTFSGTFMVQDANKEFTGETVSITEGKFSVLRYENIE